MERIIGFPSFAISSTKEIKVISTEEILNAGTRLFSQGMQFIEKGLKEILYLKDHNNLLIVYIDQD